MSYSNPDGTSIHAGFPNPATDSSLENLSLQHLLVAHPVSTFFLRITGDLWNDQGIFTGDIAIVDKSVEPRKPDLVVWWQSDSFIISKYTAIPAGKAPWGVVISIVHQYRNAKIQ